jgi:hypothetical protein
LPIGAAWPGSPVPAPPPPPSRGKEARRRQRAGIHRRPPGLPVPTLRACCRPSPCGRLSRPPSTTAAPSAPKVHSRRRACPPPHWPHGRKGNLGSVPTFPTHRLTGSVPSFSPAASPRLRRKPSAWPPRRPNSPTPKSRCAVFTPACTAARPISTRFEPALDLRGVDHWFSSAYTFPSCLPDPGHLAVLAYSVVVGAAPTLPGASRIRLPPASAACCDRAPAESFHLRPDTWNLVAHDRLPVLASGLHHHMGDALRLQPVGQRLQARGEGRIGADLLAAPSPPWPRPPPPAPGSGTRTHATTSSLPTSSPAQRSTSNSTATTSWPSGDHPTRTSQVRIAAGARWGRPRERR